MFYMSHLLNGKVTVNGLQCFQQSDVRGLGFWLHYVGGVVTYCNQFVSM